MKRINISLAALIALTGIMIGCAGGGQKKAPAVANSNDAASAVYVAPGEYDEFYGFISGGFSGQLSVQGLPSGRVFKVIPVFSVDAEKGYGFNEETKALLNTSHGFIPWDDAHHPELSQTDGVPDGKWCFINGNNTPRVARIDLATFETTEILELPNSGGNHSSPFTTENSEYIVAGTRFSVPIPQKNVPINIGKGNFKGSLSFITANQPGNMTIAFQILVPGFDYDLSHSGKGKSHGWTFFTTYNTEEAYTMKEAYASQNDKDYIAAVNWKKAEEYLAAGNFTEMPANYAHNYYDEKTQTATSEMLKTVKVLDPANCPGLIYYMPCPKSPHGVDVDPSGEYIVGAGKLSADLTVHSFDKMIAAIEGQKFDGDAYGIPVLQFDAVNAGTVSSGGLGPLHTEFDGNGNAYTSFFISSEVVKWKIGTWEVLDRVPCYYSVGHIMIPGGDSKKPWGKYLFAMNKITKDRYLPTGPEMCHSAQLYDISGEKMKLLGDFPTMGEPHYAQGIHADVVKPNSKKIYRLDENEHPFACKKEADSRVVRDGKDVHVYMTMIRSHFAPDNISGIEAGDRVYFHVTNLEQDWDTPHGLSVMGATNSELLIMPGQTETLVWYPKKEGVWPFYCTDFCSALHQEMQGYINVAAQGQGGELKWSLGD